MNYQFYFRDMPDMKTDYTPIRERTFQLAVNIVKFCAELRMQKEFEIANQLIKSGTSIGANVKEAFNAYSSRDYQFKLSIAQKETDETIYWLEIIIAYLGENKERIQLLNETTQILKIIKTMILRSKQNTVS